MRTSAGFFDTGLSGKIRIQIRPPRLMWRVIALRAASICRDVRRPRSVAFRPYSPKLTLLPTVATPLFRPFCSLRYFLLAGCSILRSWCWSRSARALRCFGCGCRRGRGLGVVRHHFTLEHPDLDADDAVGRARLGKSIIDVGTQRMQRHAAFAIPLATRDLDAVETPRAHHLDALRTEPHRVLHRALHRTAEHDPLLELLRDRVRDQLRVDLRLADLLDVEPDVAAHHLPQVAAQHLDVLALLADDNTGARAVNRDPRVLRRTLDRDLRHRRMRELLLQVLAHLQVLSERRTVVLLVGEPLRAPVAVDGEAEAGRMNLLSHGGSLFTVADDDADMAALLTDDIAAALCARGEPAQRVGLVDVDRRDLELVDVGTLVVLGVGDRRLEHLLDDPRALLRRERKDVQRAIDRQAADRIGDDATLLGRQPHAAQRSSGLHHVLTCASSRSARRLSC